MYLIIAQDGGEVVRGHQVGRLIANLLLDKACDEFGILTNNEDLVFTELPLEECERLQAKANQIWEDLIVALDDARRGFHVDLGVSPAKGTVEAEVHDEDFPW